MNGIVRFASFAWTLCALLGLSPRSSAETVRLCFDPATPQIAFAAGDIKAALESQGHTVQTNNLSALTNDNLGRKIILAVTNNTAVISNLLAQGGSPFGSLGEQAYVLRTTSNSHLNYWVVGGAAAGAMYGGLQLAEHITFDGIAGAYAEQVSPDFAQRGVKVNLPLDKRIPTYSGYTANTSTRLAIPHVWDMTFWKTWIDQQARNRYNVLSVWVHHPFPALVIVPEYPNASLPNIQRIDGSIIPNLSHTERVAFWREVMTYAHDRGFQFYFFCWNVCTEYAEDMYPGVITESESNTNTLDYLSKSMKALLETYPELDGFGISAGDNMDLPKDQRPGWTWKAYGQAAYDYAIANPHRRFSMIHRGLGTSLIDVYDDWGSVTNLPNMTFEYSIKYANAHMFSTLTPRWYESDMSDANANNQKTWLTLRNDDFLYMDMGDPEFVRGFLNGIPYRQVINSFYIGSDIYHPTRTYWCKDASMNGQLEIQRNWYIQMLWGRIAYNNQISDDVFKKHMAKRFPQVSSEILFNAWALASRPLPKVQELTQGSWGLDAHWYAESSMYPNNGGAFRFLDDFIATTVARTSSSDLCSIAESAAGTCGNKTSTYQMADEMEADAQTALNLINGISSQGDLLLEVKLNNIKQLAYLSTHFAYKIRAATYKSANQIPSAREAMGKAYCWWMKYVKAMDAMYTGNKFRTVEITPDWHYADAWQLQDYAALGGVGIPNCDQEGYALTTSATNGSVVLNPPGGFYPTNTVVTVTASPDFGYAFGNWRGDLSGTANPTNLTMNTNKSVTANFVVSSADVAPWLETFTLNDGTKSHGAPTSWIATRAAGKFEVSGNRFMINAASGEEVFETAPISIPGGSVKASLEVQAAGGIDSGDYVRFYKIVDGGAKVLLGQQIGNVTGTHTMLGRNIVGGNLKLRIEASVSASDEYYYFDNLKVEYESVLPTFTLATSAANGSVMVNPPGGIYTTGTVVTITADPNIGYAFGSWSGDLTGSTNPATITMNGNKSVTANFTPVPTYTLTTSTSNGSITLNPPGGIYNTGTVVTVTASANSGYTFARWGGDLAGSANPTNLTMNTHKNVMANFDALPPGNRNVLFVVGDAANMTNGTADVAIRDRLQSKGYTVQAMNDETATAGSAAGKALVLTSATVGAGTLGTKFRDVAVPVINWETAVQDDYGYTTTNSQGNASGQTSLNITNVGHPLAAGLAGIQVVATVPGEFSWGVPGGNPIIIARLNQLANHPCLYAYEAGAAMTTGTAPARRVHLFLQNNTFASLNADGLSLFDAAVSWAIGQAAVPPSWVQPSLLQEGQLRLEWVGGTLQTTTNVAGAWSDIPGVVSPHLQPTTNPAQFFRVKQ